MNKAQMVAHGMTSAPGLLYVLSPLDFIPDIIPVAGQADDAMVVIVTMLMNVMIFLLLKAYAPEVFKKDGE
jgi:uncharacterized membrane protein YkvA (DUF1232 family)